MFLMISLWSTDPANFTDRVEMPKEGKPLAEEFQRMAEQFEDASDCYKERISFAVDVTKSLQADGWFIKYFEDRCVFFFHPDINSEEEAEKRLEPLGFSTFDFETHANQEIINNYDFESLAESFGLSEEYLEKLEFESDSDEEGNGVDFCGVTFCGDLPDMWC